MGAGSPAVNEEEMVDVLYKAKVDGRLPTLVFKVDILHCAKINNSLSYRRTKNGSYEKEPCFLYLGMIIIIRSSDEKGAFFQGQKN
jgi:hypothetical protein